MSYSKIGIQKQLDQLQKYCTQNSLTINNTKTKIMVFRKGGIVSKEDNWSINGNEIEVVNNFKYLGFTINSQGKWNTMGHVTTR